MYNLKATFWFFLDFDLKADNYEKLQHSFENFYLTFFDVGNQ